MQVNIGSEVTLTFKNFGNRLGTKIMRYLKFGESGILTMLFLKNIWKK